MPAKVLVDQGTEFSGKLRSSVRTRKLKFTLPEVKQKRL